MKIKLSKSRLLLSSLFASSVALTSFASAETEDWYFHFALGYGIPSYPASIKADIDSIKATGASNTPVSVDLGAYFPMANYPTTIIGVSINGMNDSYSEGIESIGIIKTGVYFSTIHSFTEEPGAGFFVRGDIGFPRMAVTYNDVSVGSSEYGLGGVIGGGWGMPFGGTRLLFTGTYSLARVEGSTYGTTSLNIGGLF